MNILVIGDLVGESGFKKLSTQRSTVEELKKKII